MKKSLSIIMVVVGLQVTTWLALVNVAHADLNLGLWSMARGVVFESTDLEESHYQSNSSTGAAISSEVVFSDRTHGICGPFNLLYTGDAVARSGLMCPNSTTIMVTALEAQLGLAHVGDTCSLSSKASMSYTFINNSSSGMDISFDMYLEPINLILGGDCSVGLGAPSASYSVIFGTTGLTPCTIFSSGATFSGGITDHQLSTSGFALDVTAYTLNIPLDHSYIDYEFNGLVRHFDLGTLAPGAEATFLYSICLEATIGGQIIDPEVFDTLTLQWGASAFLGDSLPDQVLGRSIIPIPGSACLFLSGLSIIFFRKFSSRGPNRKRP